MCGRYTLTSKWDILAARFGLTGDIPPYRLRYNIAPTQEVLTVISSGSGNVAQYMKWGLVPHWAKDAAIGNRMINARAETVAQKPAFRVALKKRRCLVPADGFYEWQQSPQGKIPMRIMLKTGEPVGVGP